MAEIVVLVVDSSVMIIERWQNILTETENIKTVYGAVAYKDASLLYKQKSPNVVLLDCGLPGTMSLDLLKEFKAPNEHTLVITLSDTADNQQKEKYKSLGADFCFDKYHDFEKIPAFIVANTVKNN
jgi:DNA-binding NarL/FixJ family response regulator